ncbi:MAG: HD domain-containing protein [Candidatus Omnitrophica bacterium]|nr:HD domain-containing protein [Candidatus Omnitrophota bacterium]
MNTKNYFTPTKRYKTLIYATHSIYRLINSTFSLKDFLTRLTRLISQIFDASSCSILILGQARDTLAFKCSIVEGKKYIIDKKTKILGTIEKRIVNHVSAVKKDNLLGMPLICEDIIGLVVIKRKIHDLPFDKFDQSMLASLLEQASIGIKNLQLYEEQQRIILGSIKSLVTLLDTRIPQEYTHSPYFSRLVMAIGHQMHLDEKQIETLKYAALLHDAGKIEIPLEILTKRTKLTWRERQIIRRHPVKSAQILRPLQVIRPVIPIILHHHERYNGTGYPSKLKKEQIPLGARIMAVADAFEAMVYGRPYRERINIEAAIQEIRKKSGTQFDPKVVEAFLRVVKKIKTKKYLTR